MKIQVEKEIFPDREFCTDNRKHCDHLNYYDDECDIFYVEATGENVALSYAQEKFLKCDQCKEAWKKAKETENNNKRGSQRRIRNEQASQPEFIQRS